MQDTQPEVKVYMGKWQEGGATSLSRRTEVELSFRRDKGAQSEVNCLRGLN